MISNHKLKECHLIVVVCDQGVGSKIKPVHEFPIKSCGEFVIHGFRGIEVRFARQITLGKITLTIAVETGVASLRLDFD